jgi:hypothetical protein
VYHHLKEGQPFTDALFQSLFDRWQWYRRGLPPVEGGHARQNPHLVAAFREADAAERRVLHELNR